MRLSRLTSADLELNNILTGDDELYKKFLTGQISAPTLLETWIARQDARGWVLFGDPAVSLH